jgi:glycosyltransferase involved in cell wall biosynthesis
MIKPVIIVPCFNHGDAFAHVADKLIEYKTPVIVVDDGSTSIQSKKIKNICLKHKFIYVKNATNGGKGAAMILGFKHALENGFTHALQIDADGQHDIRDIPLFLKITQSCPDNLIIGNPLYDESAPRARLIGRKITNFWVMVETFNKNMPDTMCGFRVYPLKKLEPILKTIKFKRMGFDIEIIVKAYRHGIKIISVPTKVIYPENGTSNFHAFRDNFYISLLHTYLCCLIPVWLIRRAFHHEKNK